MHSLTLLCLVVAAVGAVAEEGSMFGGYGDTEIEVAPYTVIEETENYEVRSYGTVKWVCSHMVGSKADKRQKKKNMMRMFYSLFEYVNGKNSKEEDLDMTTPMTIQTDHLEEDVYKVKMCFYIPTALQANPPMPEDQDVYIDAREDFKVAVRTFNGWMMGMKEWENQKNILIKDLKEAEEKGVDYTKVYGAMYKPHMKTQTMNNEVWVQIA